MITASLVAFNLLVNGAFVFAFAWLLARAALRLFRARPGRAHVALLSLPFLKLAIELARGVPDGSFLWLRARGVPQELGSFHVGVGLRWLVLDVRVALSALAGGHHYPQSAADLLAAALAKKVAPWLPGAIALALIAVAAVRLSLRARAWRRTAAEVRDLRRTATLTGHRTLPLPRLPAVVTRLLRGLPGASLRGPWLRRAIFTDRSRAIFGDRFRAALLGRRRVTIVVSGAASGSPFTTGVLAPLIVFPGGAWTALSPEERRAAIAHELAHVADHHLLLATLAGVVRDVFWFVPFIGSAERHLREACELAADARAVRSGAEPAVLASALVRAREVMVAPLPAFAPALGAGGASLRARVAHLLDGAPAPRLGFQHRVPRVLFTLWIAAIVVNAITLGNH